MKYISIDKNLIPYEFEINLAGETFQFQIYYNGEFDFFTVNLFKDHKPVVYGEKVVYGQVLFKNYLHLGVPKVIIYPYDTTKPRVKHVDRVSYENLNEDVFLYVLD